MKTSEPFKKTIQDHLQKLADNDPLFAETLKKENKNIEDCCTYILNQVQKSGHNGFADEEIFGMAVHFYDEDDVEAGKPINSRVVVNHVVELTEEDKAEAKEKAMEQLISEAKVEAKKTLSETIELSEEDIQEAKKLAIDEMVSEQREKMVQKATKKQLKDVSKETKEVEKIDLFS